MTAATIRMAARLLDLEDANDTDNVTLTEIGSEGSVFYTGTWRDRGPRWLISRDGTAVREDGAVMRPD